MHQQSSSDGAAAAISPRHSRILRRENSTDSALSPREIVEMNRPCDDGAFSPTGVRRPSQNGGSPRAGNRQGSFVSDSAGGSPRSGGSTERRQSGARRVPSRNSSFRDEETNNVSHTPRVGRAPVRAREGEVQQNDGGDSSLRAYAAMARPSAEQRTARSVPPRNFFPAILGKERFNEMRIDSLDPDADKGNLSPKRSNTTSPSPRKPIRAEHFGHRGLQPENGPPVPFSVETLAAAAHESKPCTHSKHNHSDSIQSENVESRQSEVPYSAEILAVAAHDNPCAHNKHSHNENRLESSENVAHNDDNTTKSIDTSSNEPANRPVEVQDTSDMNSISIDTHTVPPSNTQIHTHNTDIANNDILAETVFKKEDLPTPTFKWLGLRKLQYKDPAGVVRDWEECYRTTHVDSEGLDAVYIVATTSNNNKSIAIGGGKDNKNTAIGGGIDRSCMQEEVVLVDQFRPPAGCRVLEFPAGLLDAGESPGIAALRELSEETGYTGTLREVSPATLAEPGMTSARQAFVNIDITAGEKGSAHLEDGEFIRTRTVPLRGLLGELQNVMQTESLCVDGALYAYALGIEKGAELYSKEVKDIRGVDAPVQHVKKAVLEDKDYMCDWKYVAGAFLAGVAITSSLTFFRRK